MFNVSLKQKFLALSSLIAVFLIDVIAPYGIAVDVMYMCCILLVFREKKSTLIFFSGLTSTLIVITTLTSHITQKGAVTVANHIISLSAVLVTTYIALTYQKMSRLKRVKEEAYITGLREMLFITSHKLRRPVANIIGLLNIEGGLHRLTADELTIVYSYLKSCSCELDTFIHELTQYIEKTELDLSYDRKSTTNEV